MVEQLTETRDSSKRQRFGGRCASYSKFSAHEFRPPRRVSPPPGESRIIVPVTPNCQLIISNAFEPLADSQTQCSDEGGRRDFWEHTVWLLTTL